MERERIDELLESVGMAEIMDCLVLQNYATGKHIKFKPRLSMIQKKITEDERLRFEEWVNERYISWYKFWQLPTNRVQLQVQIVEIGAYYQRYIQKLFGMSPDLLRPNIHTLMGPIADLVIKRVGAHIPLKDYFQLRILSNTILPDAYKDWFKQGLEVGVTKAAIDYEESLDNFLAIRTINYMPLSIFGFMEVLKLEGVKDPLWFEEFFNAPTFYYRTLDERIARAVILEDIAKQGYDTKEAARRNQLIEDFLKISTKDVTFRKLKPELVGEDTIRWRMVGTEGYILTTFGRNYILAYERDEERVVVMNRPKYAINLAQYGTAVKNLHTKFGSAATLIGILVENARLKRQNK